jgi:hypothetical protein
MPEQVGWGVFKLVHKLPSIRAHVVVSGWATSKAIKLNSSLLLRRGFKLIAYRLTGSSKSDGATDFRQHGTPPCPVLEVSHE